MSDLVIVESPTKAKTISRYLGKGYTVKSSFGHIRDLPKKDLGVDVNDHFAPTYVVEGEDKKKTVAELKKAAKSAHTIYFATDGDREGEAIAWHLVEILKPKPEQIKRITFHEITKRAIEDSLKHAHGLDLNRVYAQQARRILDRLVGYELSPFLWKKVARGLSAGRVQSVAVRLIVERERDIQAFKPREYWTIDAIFSKDTPLAQGETQKQVDQKNLPEGFFNAKLNVINDTPLTKFSIDNEKDAKEIETNMAGATFTITRVEQKETKKNPLAPFTTSTLQQEANRKLGFSSKQTMVLAQQLYEGIDLGADESHGLITYMRTDSVNLSETFLTEAHAYIKKQFGEQYGIDIPRAFTTKSKTAQEAHEAIRPTEVVRDPESVKAHLDARQLKLYTLIWSRAVASQMAEAIMSNTAVDITATQKDTYLFRATGQTIAFDGYLKVYKTAQKEALLPQLKEGDKPQCHTLDANQHFTEPPARYSDATLVKALEENEIGRPSTYSPTISTIENRGYVERDDNKKLKPTDVAFLVTDILVEHFPNISDYQFTARMENELDAIAEGKLDWEKSISEFYTPFHKNLEQKTESLSREDTGQIKELGIDPKTKLPVFVKIGRFGAYAQLGEYTDEELKMKAKDRPKLKSASLSGDVSMETITLVQALKLLELPRVVGKTTEGDAIVADIGRFGAYLRAGKKTASLPEPLDPYTISEADALERLKAAETEKKKLLEPIAELGIDPVSEGKILVKNGRFGPYITDGKTNKSIPKDMDPKSITHEQAVEMLEKKRKAPKRTFRKKKKEDE